MSLQALFAAAAVLAAAALFFLAWKLSGARRAIERLESALSGSDKGQARTEQAVRDESARNREEIQRGAREAREDVNASLQRFNEALSGRLDKVCDQVLALTRMNDERFERIRQAVEERLRAIQEDNAKQLEHIRATVDEKLHDTLDKRLGESFHQVSLRLEMVHKGLGEMQLLASGVGDLKKVLTNIKTRGILGEIQLENLLEQVLTPEQYEKNVATKKGSAERVEVAIKLPGKGDDGAFLWMPIDAKFPTEDYQRLLDAGDRGDVLGAEEATRQLLARVKDEAKTIREKYLDPPHTTDFGILFLPVEGLYAEILRAPGFAEYLHRDCQVIVAGPTNLTAILSAFQMGFRALAIQKRSSEVWALLGAVKTEFGKFGGILEKTQKKLEEATNTIEDAAKKTRTIERKLKGVQKLADPAARALLKDAEESEPLPGGAGDEPEPSAGRLA